MKIKFLVILTIFVLFSGCEKKIKDFEHAMLDGNLTLKSEKEMALAQRFLEYWEYRSTRQYEKSFQMEMPSYKFLNTIDRYLVESHSMNHDFTIKLKSISFNADEKQIAVLRRQYNKGTFQSFSDDIWLNVNGTWYHKYYFSPFPE